MTTTICLMTCALTLAQPAARADWLLAPQLAPGLELVYRGEYIDEDLIPNVQRQKRYRLDANLLVLETGLKDWQVGLTTSLRLQENPLTSGPGKDGPASLRLELARIELQGQIRSQNKNLMHVPIQGPPTLEHGFLVVAPVSKVGRDYSWDVAEQGRPGLRWQVLGTEMCGGITCIKLLGLQQSGDWERARADQTDWHRRDLVWLHPQLLVAQKVERVIERREPARFAPTHRSSVRYELDSQLKYPGKLFEDRRQEMLKLSGLFEEARPLLTQPTSHRTRIDGLLQRVSFQLERQPSSYYRHAALHLKGVLEHAQKGEALIPHGSEEPNPFPMNPISLGRRVPDFAISAFTQENPVQFKSQTGKPTLVVFYNPATALGKEVLGYVKRVSEKKDVNAGILALAVTQDGELVRKQHAELRLSFPILDGLGMRRTFGVEHTPRFVVLDGDGVMRLAETGWGVHTPYEIEDALQRCRNK